jgi:putative phosphoribosyl transferase
MFERNPIFADRVEAGRLLAARLRAMDLESPVVLALPRGGVPVGYEIAKALKAPLDALLVRKLGAPGHEEFALGAVVEGEPPIVVLNEGVPGRFEDHIRDEAARQAKEMERRRQAYRNGRPLISVAGRTAIVVDDGVATGATFRAALEAMKRMDAARVVAAIPVAPDDSLATIEALAHEVICLQTPEPFYAVGLHYADFGQTSDAEVIELLSRAEPTFSR